MTLSRRLILPLSCLLAVHLVVMLAGFFSPYDFAEQDRQAPYAPPVRIHWAKGDGQWLWHPFIYRSIQQPGEVQTYREDTQRSYPIHFFPRGSRYTIASRLSWNRHLFGVDAPAHIRLMGADGYGRDLFTRVLYGGRISLFVGLVATLLTLTLALSLGTLAGFYGGWLDAAVMRCVDVFIALPWLSVLLALRAFLPFHVGPAQAFLLLVVVIGTVGWARPARLVRGIVLSAKEQNHILAARSFGARDLYLLRRHILPETRDVVLTQAALLIPQYILAEVTLSFLGLGVGEPVPSWGSMLTSLQQYYVLASKWWMFIPAMVLIPVFLSYGLMSNALQQGMRKAGE